MKKFRKWATTLLSLVLIFGSAFVLTSCQAPPTVPEINQQYEYWVQQVEKLYQEMLKACEQAADPAACKAAAAAWRIEALQKLWEAWQAAVNQNWQDAERRKREWEEWLRRSLEEFFKKFPKLNKLPIPLFDSAQVQFQVSIEDNDIGIDPCAEVIKMVQAFREDYDQIDLRNQPELLEMVTKSLCFVVVEANDGRLLAQPQAGTTWDVSGSVAVQFNGSITNAPLSGTLGLVQDGTVPSGTKWNVVSGTLTASLPNSTSLRLTVLQDSDNAITVANNGSGHLNVLFGTRYPTLSWGAILPYLNRVHLPVTVSNGTIGIQIPMTNVTDLVPHDPWPASDYDGNGVLDFNPDFAAFMTGYSNQSALADSNADGSWTQDDVDLWIARFWEDYNAQ